MLEKDDFHAIEYLSNQVIILPILEHKFIIMPKVHRPILGCAGWELPAGGVKDGENSKEGALRELREETGLSIFDDSRLKLEHTLIVSQNRLPMFPLIFSINISKDEYDLKSSHDNEVDSVGCFSFAQIRSMILSGEILTSITISILARFLLSREIAPS